MFHNIYKIKTYYVYSVFDYTFKVINISYEVQMALRF